MMAATQPFLSGAISKTVNMPAEATVEEVMDAYIQGWKYGLKAIAIYRDGSKGSQPLNTKNEDTSKKTEAVAAAPVAAPAVAEATVVNLQAAPTLLNNVDEAKVLRRKLPEERLAITHKFEIGGHEGYLTVGLYPDGKPGEVFITMSKEGSTISGLMDAFATLVSFNLQYGVPLEFLVNKFSHMRFEPAGFTHNKQIPMAKSILDYIFRWLAIKFLDKETTAQFHNSDLVGTTASDMIQQAHPQVSAQRVESMPAPPVEEQKSLFTFQNQTDAPSCNFCGSIMVRNGSCYKCFDCGNTSGCS